VTQFGVMKNAVLTVDATAYQGKVKTALLIPATNTSTYPTLAPTGALQDVDQPVWTLQLVGVQDWATGGLAKYLTDNHGTEIDIVLVPQATDTWPQASVTVLAMAVPFGGTSGEYAEFDVTLPVVGQPTIGAYDATP